MDEPQEKFELLNNFPPDIVAYIAWFLPAETLDQMKRTGSKSFWAKFTRPNVVKYVELGSGRPPLKSWVPFLKEFPSLEELSLVCDEQTPGIQLKTLPPTLKKLNMFLSPTRAFDDLFETDDGDQFNLGECFPRLETLEIEGRLPDCSWMKHCPPTLTHLVICPGPTGSTDLVIPTSLTRFETDGNAESFHSLPPKLETLTVRNLDISCILPPSLTKLKSQSFTLIDDRPASIQMLPLTLTELDIFRLPSACWPFLPSTLYTFRSRLYATENSSVRRILDIDVETVPLQLLPRSITHLEFSESSLVTREEEAFVAEGEKILPPSLKTLIAPTIILWGNCTKDLSPSLTKLSTNILHPDIFLNFPKGLTSLALKASTGSDLMLGDLASLLPKSLTELYFSDSSHQTSEKTLAPRKTKVFRPLLPNLRVLKIGHVCDIGDDFLVNQTVPNLLDLDLHGAKRFTNQLIPLLNRNLTSLKLCCSDQIDGKCFPFLPRSLAVLNLNESSSIYDGDIQHLPRSLRAAFLEKAVHLTENCIRDFPRQMTLLRMGSNKNITESCFPDLPSPIKFGSGTFRSAYFSVLRGRIQVEEAEESDDGEGEDGGDGEGEDDGGMKLSE